MIYQASLTLDPNTSKDDPVRHHLSVTKGLVYFIEVFIPPGVSGLAGTRILDGSHQVWPSSPGEWFSGDDLLLSYQDLYLKEDKPFSFLIEAYNEDEAYDHTLIVRVALVSERAYQARFLPSVELSMYREMWERLRQEQEEERERRREEVVASPIFQVGGEY